MKVDEFERIIKDKTRREIITYLYQKGKATYTEILTDLNLSTGKLNYHLKILEPLIKKEQNYYMLNDLGLQVAQLLSSLGLAENNKLESKEILSSLSPFLSLLSLFFLMLSTYSGTLYLALSIIFIVFSAYLSLVYKSEKLGWLFVFLAILFPYSQLLIIADYQYYFPISIIFGFYKSGIFFGLSSLIVNSIYFIFVLPIYLDEITKFIVTLMGNLIVPIIETIAEIYSTITMKVLIHTGVMPLSFILVLISGIISYYRGYLNDYRILFYSVIMCSVILLIYIIL